MKPTDNSSIRHISSLTNEEAKEILKYVYPWDADEDGYNKALEFERISFEPQYNEEGRERLTFDLTSIIGIEFRTWQNDGKVLPFTNTKVINWLYKNNFDISELLEEISNLSNEASNYLHFIYDLKYMLTHMIESSEVEFSEDVESLLMKIGKKFKTHNL